MIRSRLLRRILYAAGGTALLAGGGAYLMVGTEFGFRLFLDLMYRRSFADVPLVEPEDLNNQTAKPPLLLDIRSREEYEVSHLRGARLLEPSTFTPENVGDLERDRSIVLYCAIGYRSGKMYRRLRELGFTDVRNLYGGIFLWYNLGMPVYREGTTVDTVHPYDEWWGLFVRKRQADTEVGVGDRP